MAATAQGRTTRPRAAKPPAGRPVPQRAGRPQPPPPEDPADVEMPGGFGFEPIRLSTKDIVPPARRVPCFYIDDAEYTIMLEPPMAVSLEFAHIMAEGSGTAEAMGIAVDYLLTELLGEDGYRALRRFRGLQPIHFAKISAVAVRLALGQVELPKDAVNG